MDKRVGMPVHLTPPGLVEAKDQSHPQRQVLVWQSIDFPVLSLDRYQNDHVARRVGLHDIQLRLAVAEVALQRFEPLRRGVDAALRFAAEW
jgi:hypothetical protein